jgi:hypothetical protein
MKLFGLFNKHSIHSAFDKIQGYDDLKQIVSRAQACPGSQEQLYMGSTSMSYMTRKDKMREGFVARTFHIPVDIDDEFRIKAVETHVRFSDMAILAFRSFLRGSTENDGN